MNVKFSMLAFVLSICIALAWAATRYVQEATMDGLNCRIGDTVFTMMANSTLVCAGSCKITATCKSWFYSSTSKECYGCNNSYFSSKSSFSGNASTKYYRNGDPGWLSMTDVSTEAVWVTNPILHPSRYHLGTTAGPKHFSSSCCRDIGGHLICLETDVEIDMVKGFLRNGGANDNVDIWTGMTGMTDGVDCYHSNSRLATEDWAPSKYDRFGYIALTREYEYHWEAFDYQYIFTALCEMD